MLVRIVGIRSAPYCGQTSTPAQNLSWLWRKMRLKLAITTECHFTTSTFSKFLDFRTEDSRINLFTIVPEVSHTLPAGINVLSPPINRSSEIRILRKSGMLPRSGHDAPAIRSVHGRTFLTSKIREIAVGPTRFGRKCVSIPELSHVPRPSRRRVNTSSVDRHWGAPLAGATLSQFSLGCFSGSRLAARRPGLVVAWLAGWWPARAQSDSRQHWRHAVE